MGRAAPNALSSPATARWCGALPWRQPCGSSKPKRATDCEPLNLTKRRLARYQGCPVPVLVPLERQLSRIGRGRRLDLQQAIDGPPVHQIGAHQPDEGERAVNDFLRGLRQAQQQEGDQGDGDLGLDGILAGAKKAGDLEDLLDPAKEQLDCPASLVEPGD